MEEARPFFLLDWLDDLMIDQDAFQIAELLKTPSKLPRQQNLVGYSSHNHVSTLYFLFPIFVRLVSCSNITA